MIRIGVQAASLRVPFKKALPLIASMHATGVELDARGELRPGSLTETGLRQVRKLLDDYGLSVAAVSFQTRRGYDVAEDLEHRIEATKQALQLAYSLGCSVVLNQVGRIPSQEQQPDAWQRLVDSLTDIGRFSQRAGAWLAMTTASRPTKASANSRPMSPTSKPVTACATWPAAVDWKCRSDAARPTSPRCSAPSSNTATRASGRSLANRPTTPSAN
jgi:hypothetical protein